MFLQLYSLKELCCWIIEKFKSIIWIEYLQFRKVRG
jgi:hypothetical protein